ncbi:MAG TPA: COX15/CtaA family protein [Thermomicrobiaceae bacterium]|nr:COX15/CtaA family protein [Thermomicrobiaceae bacterium]
MRRYERLTAGTILAGFGLIVFGGVVRVSGSGMGCGPNWPVCNGQVVPVFSLATAIEYTHRLLAALVTLLTVGLVLLDWHRRREVRSLLQLPILALALVLAQAGLGAVAVLQDLSPWVVAAHLGMAEAYLGCVVVLGVALVAQRRTSTPAGRELGALAPVAAAAVYLVTLTGAYTAASGASLACGWPLCGDRVVPTGWTPVDVQLTHRWAALAAIVAVVALALRARRVRPDRPRLAQATTVAAVTIAVQALIGAANVWLGLAPWVRELHLAVAVVIWAMLVGVAAADRLLGAPAHGQSTAPRPSTLAGVTSRR